MTPKPTGRLSPTAPNELQFVRTFRAPIQDVWASITEPERTARWFASWSGEAGAGQSIRYRMVFEEGAPEAGMLIEACEPPRRLVVSTVDEHGNWRLEARLTEASGITELVLVHHIDGDTPIGDIGPGWEYYLDMLVASRSGLPQPTFDDYYPAQKAYYEALR